MGTAVVDAAVRLRQALGPGLLEVVYGVTLARELQKRGLRINGKWRERGGERFDEGFRADLIVEGKVIVELKSVEGNSPAHKKQILTYLRLSGMKLGYLLNFGEALMKDGITRTINGDHDADLRAPVTL
jgi:GxxExxY protein